MKYYIFCSTASSNITDLTHTHARTHTKAMSCESKTVSCAPHPPTFSHLTIDKSRWQVHIVHEGSAQSGLRTSTHRTHSRTFVQIDLVYVALTQEETPKLDTAVRQACSVSQWNIDRGAVWSFAGKEVVCLLVDFVNQCGQDSVGVRIPVIL